MTPPCAVASPPWPSSSPENEENRKTQDRMSDLASKLQQKIGAYKKYNIMRIDTNC